MLPHQINAHKKFLVKRSLKHRFNRTFLKYFFAGSGKFYEHLRRLDPGSQFKISFTVLDFLLGAL